jgi:hypothetical protein
MSSNIAWSDAIKMEFKEFTALDDEDLVVEVQKIANGYFLVQSGEIDRKILLSSIPSGKLWPFHSVKTNNVNTDDITNYV